MIGGMHDESKREEEREVYVYQRSVCYFCVDIDLFLVSVYIRF